RPAARPLERFARTPPAHVRTRPWLAADDARTACTGAPRHAPLRAHDTGTAPRCAGAVRADARHGQEPAPAAARAVESHDCRTAPAVGAGQPAAAPSAALSRTAASP